MINEEARLEEGFLFVNEILGFSILPIFFTVHTTVAGLSSAEIEGQRELVQCRPVLNLKTRYVQSTTKVAGHCPFHSLQKVK